jgi:hypothetical protein
MGHEQLKVWPKSMGGGGGSGELSHGVMELGINQNRTEAAAFAITSS